MENDRNRSPKDKLGFVEANRELSHEYDEMMLKYLSLIHMEEQAESFQALLDESELDELENEDSCVVLFPNVVEETGSAPQQEDDLGCCPPFTDEGRPDLDAAVLGMIREERRVLERRSFGKQLRRYGSMAACFLCVFGIGFATLFCTVDAVRLNVVGFIMRTYQTHTSFQFEKKFGELPDEIPEIDPLYYPRPTYIPDGFYDSEGGASQLHAFEAYETDDKEKYFTYSCNTLGASISLDTEACTQESIYINGNEGFLYIKYEGPRKGYGSVIWHDDQYVYLVSGSLARKELIRVAESVATPTELDNDEMDFYEYDEVEEN